MWDPGEYQRFTDERSRPFFELLASVRASDPGYVVDLGCGPGNLTAALAQRWPGADVVGVDNSAEMLSTARAKEGQRPGLSFAFGDLRDWRPARPVDVLVSSAVLQWVPGHLDLLRRWPEALAPGGWLAIQLPSNHDQPVHTILHDMVRSDRWRPLLAGVQLNRQAGDPAEYVDVLTGAGCEVDAWATTYVHVLAGDDPVTDWYRGTGLRPVLAALGPGQAEEFAAAYGERVRAAYPPRPYGTVFPFRRVFAVARRTRG